MNFNTKKYNSELAPTSYVESQKTGKSQTGFTIVELLIVVVVIAILAAIVVVAYNGVTQRAKYSAMVVEISQWKKKSELHKVEEGIVCPADYVFVYGNATLGTSDFCVMKYEAKIQGNDNGRTAYAASMVAESRAEGTPWVNISQTNAIAEAAASCEGCRLLTDAEWMTIAADVLSVKYNWSGIESGAVGTGSIFSGHNDNSPTNALAAGADSDAYSGTGNSKSSSPNQMRTLYLTSGDVIWDMSGNVWEWTNATIAGSQQPGLTGDSGYAWKQWNNSSILWRGMPASSRPNALVSLPGLSNINTWTTSHGIGQLFSNYSETGTRGFFRGGGWNNTTDTGILTLDLIGTPSYTDISLGFRVAK